MLKDICNYLGMEFAESVIAPGMNGRTSAKENKRLLEDARVAGLKAMRSLYY
jgi:hypothetical protein